MTLNWSFHYCQYAQCVWTPYSLVNEKSSREDTELHLQGIKFRRILATAGQTASFRNPFGQNSLI
jgi:hypothetical protein